MQKATIRILLNFAGAMGRRITHGLLEYGRAREDWSFEHPPDVEASEPDRRKPEEVDAIIGRIEPDMPKVLQRLPKASRPVLVNTSRQRDVKGAANVTVDDRRIGELAAEYLLGKDLAEYAFFSLDSRGGQRGRAFVRCIREAGRAVTEFVPPMAHEGWYAGLAELARPVGLLAFNDAQAALLVNGLLNRGIQVPRDIAVVGVDNDEFEAMFAAANLTSIDPDFQRVGLEAARVMDGLLRGEPLPPEPIRVPPRGLIERESTDFPGEADELAVAAARIIRRQACEGLTVDQLVEALPSTYRTLNRRFQKAFGESLHQRITRLRLQKAKDLLAGTNQTVREIGEQVGFNHATYFCTAFKKKVGLTPEEFRNQARSAPAGKPPAELSGISGPNTTDVEPGREPLAQR